VSITQRLREAEVEELDAPVTQDMDVRRREIPVQHAPRVSRFESRRHLMADCHRVVDGKRSAPQPIGERLALDELHHEDGYTVVRVLETVKRRDTRVVQRGEDARFLPEPRETIGLPRELVGQRLERHLAAEPGVAGRGRPPPCPRHPARKRSRMDPLGYRPRA